MEEITTQATLSTITLLAIANSGLLIIAGYFLKQFVGDVRKLTERVIELEKQHAVLRTIVEHEISNHPGDL